MYISDYSLRIKEQQSEIKSYNAALNNDEEIFNKKAIKFKRLLIKAINASVITSLSKSNVLKLTDL